MKNFKGFCLILLVIALNYACSRPTSHLNLNENWKFTTGDNKEFSKANFDDSSWKTIKCGEAWESQGFKDYDGIAWYRLKIVIPSTLRPTVRKPIIEGIELKLGKIDDNDISYLNGHEIGRTFGYNINRQYFIPLNQILWDKENVIAIRVEDTGGGGGLTEGPYLLKLPVISDILTITGQNIMANIEETKDTLLKPVICFKWSIPVSKLKGSIRVRVENTSVKSEVADIASELSIGKMADSNYTYQVPVQKAGIYKAYYCFKDSAGDDSCKASSLIAYKKMDHFPDSFATPVITKKIPDKCMAFPYGEVKLQGYLEDRLLSNLNNRLLKIDENGILECFYNRPGKQEWVGEYAGKYLHAASRVWQYTRSKALKSQMDRITDILLSCQDENGYLGTYLPADHWTSWDVWAHKYDLLGLLSYYAATGYKPALITSRKIGDLLCSTFGTKPGQLDLVKAGYHVGMAPCSVLEPMTDLYRFTGEQKYLDFCNYIIEDYETPAGPKIISTLNSIGKVDKTANGKAYEMMSNLVGIVKLYQITGNEKLITAAKAAWNDISMNKLYITGTASAGEHFKEDFDLPADNKADMGEGCVSVTWLQFSQALYYLTAEPKYLDEIEKTIYNHLLAAENPQTGCVSYYTALIGKKPYRCSIDGNCCLASVPRGFALIPELTYAKLVNGGLAINIYSAGSINGKIKTPSGKEATIKATIETDFPTSGKVKMVLNTVQPGRFTLALRVPAWSKNFVAKCAGKNYAGEAGKYLEIDQNWDHSYIIEISFDLNPHFLDGGKSYPAYQAIQLGPQVLAFDQLLNPEISDPDKISFQGIDPHSVIKNHGLPANWVGSEKFLMKAKYENKDVDLKLVPFADAGQTEGDVRVWLKK
jgi:DUF1680 family protein